MSDELEIIEKAKFDSYFKKDIYITNIKDKITNNIITKFEKSKIIGVWADILAKNGDVENPYEQAKLDFTNKAIPLYIARKLPSEIIELWSLDEFE